jgi:hypothetical protein
MKRWTGIALIAGTLAVLSPMTTAAAAPTQTVTQKIDVGKTTDFGARRYDRRYRPYYRPDPYYYARPYYYRPYPYSSPAPFTFGFGFGPFWW